MDIKFEPALSICVPTYSRKFFLQNLLSQLVELVEQEKFNIEICVADNSSHDDTWAYLTKLAGDKNYISIKLQPKNIGGNRNLIDITSMARSEWILVMGDDDMIIEENLSKLLNLLPTLDEVDYVLLNTKVSEAENLFNFEPGPLSLKTIEKSFCKSINEFGFCGSHLMRREVANDMRNRVYEDLRTWPSFGTFTYNALTLKKRIYFLDTPVVWQNRDGHAMFWQPTDWLKLMIRMQNVFLINTENYRNTAFQTIVIQRNTSSALFFKSFYRALIYLREETLSVLVSEEYLNLQHHIPRYRRIFNYIVLRFIKIIPMSITYFIIKNILKRNLDDYIYTGKLDEKDGINQDPEILTKSD